MFFQNWLQNVNELSKNCNWITFRVDTQIHIFICLHMKRSVVKIKTFHFGQRNDTYQFLCNLVRTTLKIESIHILVSFFALHLQSTALLHTHKYHSVLSSNSRCATLYLLGWNEMILSASFPKLDIRWERKFGHAHRIFANAVWSWYYPLFYTNNDFCMNQLTKTTWNTTRPTERTY